MRRHARPVLIALLVMGAVAGAFVGVVVPLFQTGGPPRAEVNGLTGIHLRRDVPTEVPLAVDNTGKSIIDPLCLAVSVDAGAALDHAVFQNQYRYDFTDGVVCGGALTGSETINVVVVITAHSDGVVNVSVTPRQGTVAIGAPLRETVDVAP